MLDSWGRHDWYRVCEERLLRHHPFRAHSLDRGHGYPERFHHHSRIQLCSPPTPCSTDYMGQEDQGCNIQAIRENGASTASSSNPGRTLVE
jgi:hypothetical protein